MSKLRKISLSGESAGEIDWPEGLLQTKRGAQAVRDAVVNTRNRQRAGTASTLSKGEVAGSNRKPWRQKGTGRARAGYRQSPVWRGGAVAFGPHPRNYGGKLNKKVARLAFSRALSEKIVAGDITVIEALTVSAPKTSEFAAMLKALKIERGVLFLTDSVERNVRLATRNLPCVAVMRAADVGTAELLRYPQVIVTEAGLDVLKARIESYAGGAQ